MHESSCGVTHGTWYLLLMKLALLVLAGSFVHNTNLHSKEGFRRDSALRLSARHMARADRRKALSLRIRIALLNASGYNRSKELTFQNVQIALLYNIKEELERVLYFYQQGEEETSNGSSRPTIRELLSYAPARAR